MCRRECVISASALLRFSLMQNVSFLGAALGKIVGNSRVGHILHSDACTLQLCRFSPSKYTLYIETNDWSRSQKDFLAFCCSQVAVFCFAEELHIQSCLRVAQKAMLQHVTKDFEYISHAFKLHASTPTASR